MNEGNEVMSHRLIVLPDDTADAIIDPIKAARHALNIRMFLFTDPSLLEAVIADREMELVSQFAYPLPIRVIATTSPSC